MPKSFSEVMQQLADLGLAVDVGTAWHAEVGDLDRDVWQPPPASTENPPGDRSEMPAYASSRPGRRLVSRRVSKVYLYRDPTAGSNAGRYVRRDSSILEGKNRPIGSPN